METTRFGVGERVKYKVDWPEFLAEPIHFIPKGTPATVVMAPKEAGDVFLVRLDEALSGCSPEMTVSGEYLEPE